MVDYFMAFVVGAAAACLALAVVWWCKEICREPDPRPWSQTPTRPLFEWLEQRVAHIESLHAITPPEPPRRED